MAEKDPAFAARLKSVLEQRQLTQAKAASACGITITALQNYLGGRAPQPTQARALAKGLEVSLGWLLDGIGDQQSLGWQRQADAPVAHDQAKATPYIDFDAAEFVLGRTLEAAAVHFDATPAEVRSWREGATPPLDKLVRLTNLILFEATGGRFQLRELEPSPALPAVGNKAKAA